MKRFLLIGAALFCLSPVFSLTRPSIDGRAVVAESGDLPKGLFAQSVGYLPGDTVSVTNPATGVTVDVLILGALDPSEGIAIKLSEEAAGRLFISKDSDVQVKITKRNGTIDKVASGTAVVEVDPDKDAAASLPAEIRSAVDAADAERIVKEDPDGIPESVLPEEDDGTDETPAAEDPAVSAAAEEDIIADGTAGMAGSAADDAAAEEPVSETPAPSPAEEIIVSDAEDTAAETAAEEILETEPAVPEGLPVIAEEDTGAEDAIYPDIEEETYPDTSVLGETAVTLVPADTAAADSEMPESLEPAVSADSSGASVVLSPTDMNPPPEGEKETDIVSLNPVPVFEGNDAAEKDISDPSEGIAGEAKPDVPVTGEFGGEIVYSLSDLEPGKYYVQIAVLNDTENLAAIANNYASVYPLVFVPDRAGSSSYQVLVGPLSVDEYGVVITRFKDYGYTDAFVRKIR